jgi:hypothetical protein
MNNVTPKIARKMRFVEFWQSAIENKIFAYADDNAEESQREKPSAMGVEIFF